MQGSIPLPRREKSVLILTTLFILWTTWSCGGFKLWSFYVAIPLALVTLAVAVWPTYEEGWRRFRTLVCFPVFWLGLFVLTYMLVQYFNASWIIEKGLDGHYHVGRLDYVPWLPNGVEVTFPKRSPLLLAMYMCPAFMMFCACWVALERPKAVRGLLWVLALNTALYASVGMLQSVLGFTKILGIWTIPYRTWSFWGTLYNTNHSAAFMNVGIAAAFMLLAYHTCVSSRSKEFTRGGAFLMLIPLAIIMVAGVLQTMSRGGIVLGVVVVIVPVLVYFYRFIRFLFDKGARSLTIVAAVVIALVVIIGGSVITSNVDMQSLEHEMNTLLAINTDSSAKVRTAINEASMDMFEERPVLGYGAFCYGYFVVRFQERYPALNPKVFKKNIVHAHNEYLGFPCELGLVGAIPLALCVFGPLFYALVMRFRGWDSASLIGLAGLGAILLHCALSILMHQPLVLMQFLMLLFVVCRYMSQRHFANSRHRRAAASKVLF